jgi:hypothetical protein
MASILNADDGVVSGSAGLKSTADSSGVLALQTNGATAVTVTAAGSVGIGTASPGQALDIQKSQAWATLTSTTGTLSSLFKSSNTGGSSYFGRDNSTGGVFGSAAYATVVYGSGAYPMTFHTNDTERMRILSGGNVGIGTSSPASILDISSPATVLRLASTTGTNAVYQRITNDAGQLYFGIDNSAGNDLAAGSTAHAGVLVAPGTTRNLHFGTNGTVRATITPAGDVGFGTTSGDIFSNSFARSLSVFSSGGGTTTAINVSGGAASRIQFGVGFTRYGLIYQDDTNFMQIATTTALPISFVTNNAERMRLTAAGNLGIGTSSPDNLLDVKAADGVTGVITVCGGFSNSTAAGEINSAIKFRSNDPSVGGDQTGGMIASVTETTNGAYAGLAFYTYQQGGSPALKEQVRITYDGKVGVNTVSPDAFFEVQNSTSNFPASRIQCVNASYTSQVVQLRASRNTTNETFFVIRYFNDGAGAYKFNVADSGNVTNTNGSYGTISDVKMKTDIVDAGSQWADIKAIRFRKYKMKDDPSGLLQLGVVAQELEQTSAGLISEHKDVDGEGVDLGTTTKSVKTSILFMKAAKALQEAMTRIEQLEARLDAANL